MFGLQGLDKLFRVICGFGILGLQGSAPEAPSTPTPPTAAQNMADYVNSYPALFELNKKYAPQEAAMNIDLAQKYAQPLAAALKTGQDALYPTETAITEQAGETALAGMSEEMPAWAKDQYQSDLRANLGSNAGSGMSADYMSRGLREQQKGWNDYYTNLGLSIAGKQPVYSAQQPGYTNQLGGYTAQGVGQTNAQNYQSYSGAYANMYGSNAGFASNQNNLMQGYAKMGVQGLGGAMSML